MKGDKEVVMAAVAQNGSALRWASNKLKSDKEVVSEAVAGYTCSDNASDHTNPEAGAPFILYM